MWREQRTVLSKGFSEAIVIVNTKGRQLTNSEVLCGWRDYAEFREFFITMLASTNFPGFFWEMKPFTRDALEEPCEFVLIRADTLAEIGADPSAFAYYMNTAAHVVTFPNLSGDAILIVPNQISGPNCYGHIAAFVRSAPSEQRHSLLQLLAMKAEERIAADHEPLCISTAGLGVSWLHVRLDAYPKYYRHEAYKF